MPDVITFEEAVEATEGQNRKLLIGNGFSIQHFSYHTLLEKAGLDPDGPLRKLFDVLGTVDFEVVIRSLEDAALVEETYEKLKRAKLLRKNADKLRRALVHSVRWVHPANRDDIEDVIPACAAFLKRFEVIFTLNYDLLLYWVILADTNYFKDGFGLGQEQNGFLGPFQTAAHCNIYNLHGGLHLFRTAQDEVEKRVMVPGGVIGAIAETITSQKRLPIYVAEGTTDQKLAEIFGLPYLRHCYQKLCSSEGPFFVYGHSASQNDGHIYDALFKSGISHLYFCIHQPTADIQVVAGELARYKERNGSEIEITFVDSETAPVWSV